MDTSKSPRGRREWEESIAECNRAVPCGEELHQVLSEEHIQREAPDWGAARKVCGSCCSALLIRQTHASLGHLPCLCTHAWEQRQINYCNVGKHQDKMTWPRFDRLPTILFCSFKLLSKRRKVRSCLTVTFLEYKRPHFSLCLCRAIK